MVFQKSNPFPKSIFDNVAYGLKINGLCAAARSCPSGSRRRCARSALWDEVKDRLAHLGAGALRRTAAAALHRPRARGRAGGAPDGRAASALDPIATQKIEELIYELKRDYTIVIVTHNMQQAARVSEYTAFFMLGRLVEYDRTEKIFTNPGQKITEDYITGRFG